MLKKVSSIPFHGTAEQEAQLKAVIEENKHDKKHAYACHAAGAADLWLPAF